MIKLRWLGMALWNLPGRKAEAREQVAAAVQLVPQKWGVEIKFGGDAKGTGRARIALTIGKYVHVRCGQGSILPRF